MIGKFSTISIASRTTGITGIQCALSGRAFSAGGYIWRYEDEAFGKHKLPKPDSPIIQYSKDMKIVKVYQSIREASKENNIFPNIIRKVLSGDAMTARGFIWKYAS